MDKDRAWFDVMEKRIYRLRGRCLPISLEGTVDMAREITSNPYAYLVSWKSTVLQTISFRLDVSFLQPVEGLIDVGCPSKDDIILVSSECEVKLRIPVIRCGVAVSVWFWYWVETLYPEQSKEIVNPFTYRNLMIIENGSGCHSECSSAIQTSVAPDMVSGEPILLDSRTLAVPTDIRWIGVQHGTLFGSWNRRMLLFVVGHIACIDKCLQRSRIILTCPRSSLPRWSDMFGHCGSPKHQENNGQGLPHLLHHRPLNAPLPYHFFQSISNKLPTLCKWWFLIFYIFVK